MNSGTCGNGASNRCSSWVSVRRETIPHRLVVLRILKGLNLLIFGTHIRDANAPFRLMRTTFLQEALRQFPGDVFAPNVFLSLIAAKLPVAVLEVPVQHFQRSTGTGSLNLLKLVRICLRWSSRSCCSSASDVSTLMARKRKKKKNPGN